MYFEDWAIFGAYFCYNQESPYYCGGIEREEGPRDLCPKEQLTGCSKIKHNGKRIPAEFFKWIPSYSSLRILPPEQLIQDFSGKEYLEPERECVKETQETMVNQGRMWERTNDYRRKQASVNSEHSG
jgi:hypothetical protein